MLPLTSIPEKENNGSKVVSLSFNGNAEFKPRFNRWLQTGKVAEIYDLDSLSVQERLEAR